ncbi:MAG: LacI family DNA-binding transcriptional regulator [candidate division NC10 bacterium]|nr:LacI family DNA-binding transcriptional regulator [candidate division NC10 bacterium]
MSHRPARVTRLKDVARLARVSTATVSRILNDHGPASEAARSRVLHAARELDYHPNWLARSLRGLRTNTVGLVLPDIENPFFTSLVKGVEQAASAKGWNVIFCNTDEDIRREEALVGTLVDRKIDGLILCPAAGSHDYMARYLERRLPVVTVNRALRDLPLPAVTSDNFQGAYEATHHLLAKGLRRLAIILGTPNVSTTQDRLAGCRRAADEFGLGADDLLLKVGYARTAQGYQAALECLDTNSRPQAIFAFNNLMAEAALMAIHRRRVRCPDDIALMGFDDFRSAAALTPPLSVVEQNPVGMGVKAVEELARVIETGEPAQALSRIPTRLVLRASCGCATTPE